MKSQMTNQEYIKYLETNLSQVDILSLTEWEKLVYLGILEYIKDIKLFPEFILDRNMVN